MQFPLQRCSTWPESRMTSVEHKLNVVRHIQTHRNGSLKSSFLHRPKIKVQRLARGTVQTYLDVAGKAENGNSDVGGGKVGRRGERVWLLVQKDHVTSCTAINERETPEIARKIVPMRTAAGRRGWSRVVCDSNARGRGDILRVGALKGMIRKFILQKSIVNHTVAQSDAIHEPVPGLTSTLIRADSVSVDHHESEVRAELNRRIGRRDGDAWRRADLFTEWRQKQVRTRFQDTYASDSRLVLAGCLQRQSSRRS